MRESKSESKRERIQAIGEKSVPVDCWHSLPVPAVLPFQAYNGLNNLKQNPLATT